MRRSGAELSCARERLLALAAGEEHPEAARASLRAASRALERREKRLESSRTERRRPARPRASAAPRAAPSARAVARSAQIGSRTPSLIAGSSCRAAATTWVALCGPTPWISGAATGRQRQPGPPSESRGLDRLPAARRPASSPEGERSASLHLPMRRPLRERPRTPLAPCPALSRSSRARCAWLPKTARLFDERPGRLGSRGDLGGSDARRAPSLCLLEAVLLELQRLRVLGYRANDVIREHLRELGLDLEPAPRPSRRPARPGAGRSPPLSGRRRGSSQRVQSDRRRRSGVGLLAVPRAGRSAASPPHRRGLGSGSGRVAALLVELHARDIGLDHDARRVDQRRHVLAGRQSPR